MHKQSLQQNTLARPLVYRLVFGALYTKWLVAIMFAFFLLHPAVPVFAADAEVADAGTTVSEASEKPKPEKVDEISKESEDSSLPTAAHDEAVQNEVQSELSVANSEVTESDTSPESPTPQLEEAEQILEATREESVPESTEADEHETVITTPDATVASSTDPMGESPESPESTSTTTEPLPEAVDTVETPVVESPQVPVQPLAEKVDETEENTSTTTKEIVYIYDETVNDTNRHSFGVNECVSVGGGSYYCHEANGNDAISTDNAAYAAPDSEGDHEIYLRLDGEVQQLTYNNYDDRAPYYDVPAGQIVFHRLLDGRYQIFSYDLASQSESQLTYTPENSMEPTQADGVTVWQEWVGDNWEIAALIDGEVKLLSESIHNDVAPSVKDGYVMWHTMDNSGQKLLSVYEMKTGQTSLVSDPEGGQVSNPRFVLVYDTTFNNGDTVTKTYDPETGAIQPISSNPWRDKPVIPDPEPGGEASAIINLKPTTRDNSRATSDIAGPNPEPISDDEIATSSPLSSEPTNASSSVTNTFDIDLTSTSSEPLELTEFDLIVEPFSSTSSAQQTDSASSSNSVE